MEIPDRTSLLRRLIVDGHVNVAERRLIGSVGRQEAAQVVKTIFLEQGSFPARRASGAVYEGATLAQVPSGIHLTWDRAFPLNPKQVAQRRVEFFTDLDDAIDVFIDSEWKAGIDGIPLDPSH